MNTSDPLFVAQVAYCFYPMSTIYDSCPRYLFYALLVASCLTRWTGWLADVFLGAAATYAGTAAIESFIIVASPTVMQDPSPVTIPFLPNDTSLWHDFSELVTDSHQVMIQPAASDLDSDAVLAIVVTGYLVFLPLQGWSRVLTHERARNVLFYLWNILMLAGSICALVYAASRTNPPVQYMFCYPDIPPYEETTSDGWHDSWRTSTWNESVWETFTNTSQWARLGNICYNPCFNTSQVLRKPDTLQSMVWTTDSVAQPSGFWSKVVYSNRYIYSLIILCFLLNLVLLTFKWLPYRSSIPSSHVVDIWKARRQIWNSFKNNFGVALSASACGTATSNEKGSSTGEDQRSKWRRVGPFLTLGGVKACVRILADLLILFGLFFSIIISPLTTIGFVVWIEWWIHYDGPQLEGPQQVGQWAFLVSIALLILSAVILALKYRLATAHELDVSIVKTKDHLAMLEQRRDAFVPSRAVTFPP